MIEMQIFTNPAPSAGLFNPLRSLSGSEVGKPFLALRTWLSCALIVMGLQSPLHASVSGNANWIAAGLTDVSDQHAFLAVAFLAAEHAGYVVSPEKFGTRPGLINHVKFEGFNSARLGAKSAPAVLYVGLLPVEFRGANLTSKFDTTLSFSSNSSLSPGLTKTSFRAETGLSPASVLKVRGEAFEGGAALLAGCVDFWHTLSTSINLGEFGGTLNVALSAYSDNTEPSRACNPVGARGAEGVTTRACGNNTSPMSAQHRSNGEDIVWTMRRRIEIELKCLIKNTFFDSGYETLNVAPSQVFTSASYNYKQAAVAITISGLEELQNAGEERIIDLLESRIRNAERTMANNISSDMYSDGTASGSKQIGGLQLLVSDSPSTPTVGGISSSTWSFWQNQHVTASTVAAGSIVGQMNALYASMVRGNDVPDLILADNNYYTRYLKELQIIQRVASDEMAQAGFVSLKYMNSDVVLDGGYGGNCPTDHMYFLNTNYIFFRPHSKRNMVPIGDDRFSINQDALVRLIGFAGNMTVSNRFLQGVITAA